MTIEIKPAMPKTLWPIAELVPHSRTMLLLDELVDYSVDFLQAKIRIKPDSLFINKQDEVPAWVGIEYMAQAIAAYAGVLAKLNNEEIKIGLLIGTRKYKSEVPSFPLHSELNVKVAPLHGEENGLGVFNCEIFTDQPLVQANLNVYQPKDVSAFLAGEKP